MSLYPRNLTEYLALAGLPRGNQGKVFLVDSVHGNAAYSGTDAVHPLTTLALALAKCTAHHGDVIVLAPKHAEALAAVDTLNVAGVRIVGLGTGDERPALTVNAVCDGISLEADDIVVENVRFPTPTAAATACINVAAARAVIRNCGFAQGANAVNAITVTAAGELPTIENCDVIVSADGPSAWIKFEGVVDCPVIQHNVVIGSEGANAYDQGAIDFNNQAVTNPIVRENVFLGAGVATTIVAQAGAVVGSCIGPNVYAGSATGADNTSEESEILDQLSGASGIPTFPAAAAPGNNVSIAEVLRAAYTLLAPTAVTGTADIDIDQADYTAYQNLVTIAPAAGAPLADVEIIFDLAKAATGFAAGHAAQTIQFAVARKVDGAAYRIEQGFGDYESVAISGTNAAGRATHLRIGSIGVTEACQIHVKLSAENAVDVELPYVLYYKGIAAPTVTPVAAA